MDEHGNAAKLIPPEQNPKALPDINFFASTNFRNQNHKFGIKLDDRRRHMYVVGKTGMGKTTLLENMVLNDIYSGHGVGLVDPHGDYAEKIINFIPSNRINDVVYFNPADLDYPIGFNILETVRPEQKHLVASGLMGVFKKIWPDVWSPRMEYILNNTILALLDFPGTTLLGINRMFADEEYRSRIVNNTKDPVVKAFWEDEFANYNERYATEAVAAIQNKIGQFLSASVIRNIVAQVKSRIDIREIMDNRKILIMNLSKGRIGEDNSRLLGGMLITRLQLAAMERVDIPEKDRKDFFLYVDEFQNFATESFANILSEARKYRLDLIMAHQYMEQLDEKVLAAVIGNVGTTISFRVGSTDAEILAKEFVPTFTEEDMVNLPKFQVYLKLMIDGVASRPFSATTLPPIGSSTDSAEKVVKVSRERYAVAREKIEEKIMRWSGMGHDTGDDLEVDPGEPKALPPPQKPQGQQQHQQSGKKDQKRQGGGNNSGPKSFKPGQHNQGGKMSFGPKPPDKRKDDKKKNQHQQPQNHHPQQPQVKKEHQEPRPDAPTEEVLIVDPNQKGILLTEAIGNPPHEETEKIVEEPKIVESTLKIEVKQEHPKVVAPPPPPPMSPKLKPISEPKPVDNEPKNTPDKTTPKTVPPGHVVKIHP
jgi:hypothetical protein